MPHYALPAGTLFKILNPDGSCCHGGEGQWFLPTGGRPGRWMHKIADPVLCKRGYHLVDAAHLLDWTLPAILTAEGRGVHVTDGLKSCWEQARLLTRLETWTGQIEQLFIADCAEHVSEIWNTRFPKDERVKSALRARRQFAFSLITQGDWNAAAGAAKEVVAAVGAGAWAAWAAGEVAGAAEATAWAVGAAAWAAGATWAAGTAGEAAGAAEAAAWAAEATAWAAGAAARAAERAWQNTRLLSYLQGNVDIAAIRASVALE